MPPSHSRFSFGSNPVTAFTESVVEQLESIGWRVKIGAEIAPGDPAAERGDYGQVVLAQRLRDALARLNRALYAAVHMHQCVTYSRTDSIRLNPTHFRFKR